MAKVTLEDVARAAGVSLATVDRVVNRRGGVSADKEAAILKAARRLGLDRHLAIRPTLAKRVAILIQPPSNPFHDQLRQGIEQARAIHRDLNLLFQVEHVDPARPDLIAARIARAAAWPTNSSSDLGRSAASASSGARVGVRRRSSLTSRATAAAGGQRSLRRAARP